MHKDISKDIGAISKFGYDVISLLISLVISFNVRRPLQIVD